MERLERFCKGMPQLRQQQDTSVLARSASPSRDGSFKEPPPASYIKGPFSGSDADISAAFANARHRRPSLKKYDSDARLARFLMQEGKEMPTDPSQR